MAFAINRGGREYLVIKIFLETVMGQRSASIKTRNGSREELYPIGIVL